MLVSFGFGWIIGNSFFITLDFILLSVFEKNFDFNLGGDIFRSTEEERMILNGEFFSKLKVSTSMENLTFR